MEANVNECAQSTIWNQKPFQFILNSTDGTKAYDSPWPMNKKMERGIH